MTVENPFGVMASTPVIQQSNNNEGMKGYSNPADEFGGQIPEDVTDLNQVDSMIAQQMSTLTVQDREAAYLDVHGISYLIEETPELISSKLVEMENHIRNQHYREAYNIAESMNPQYVHDPEFRLMFLRADLFDAKSAAVRLIKHFDLKRDLFGVEKLTVEITQDDLDKEAMDCLYSCYCQYLRAPDRSNRMVSLWVSCAEHESYDIKALLRREFYRNMHLARTSIDAQRMGLVSILNFLSRPSGMPFPYDQALQLPKLASAVPMRVAAFHMFSNNTWLAPLLALVKHSFSLVTRIRIRTHYGSHNECLASIQGHGIPPELLPIQEGGIITNKEWYREQLRELRKQERMQYPRRPFIFVPCSYDVLFGKGSSVQTFEGNKRMRRIVSDRQYAYEKAEKGKKVSVAQEVVDIVLESSGMFLKQAEDGGEYWLAVDNETARTKVSAAFRTLRISSK